MKWRLNNKIIDAATPKFDKQKGVYKNVKLSDGEGLELLVTTEHKIWRARYFYAKKEQNLTYGFYPHMSVKQARQENAALRQELQNGEDPKKNRQKKKQAQIDDYKEQRRIAKGESHPDSLGAIAEDWLSEVKKKWKTKTWAAEAKRIRLHIIKPIGHLLIKDVKAEHIRPIFESLHSQGKYSTLKKVAEKTSSIFNFGFALDKCEHNPAHAIWNGLVWAKPAKKSLPSITDPGRIGELLLDIGAYANEAITNPKSRRGIEVCYAARILPYVFLRPSHMVEGKRSEIDWKAKQWCIPGERMKNGKDFIVPLAPQVITMLKQLEGYTGESEYIFPSKLADTGHITIEAVNKIFSRIGYKGEMCGHGWRSSFVTNGKENCKYKRDVIYKQMSHTLETDAAKAAYDKAEFLPERIAMMQDYANYLDRLKEAARKERTKVTAKDNKTMGFEMVNIVNNEAMSIPIVMAVA